MKLTSDLLEELNGSYRINIIKQESNLRYVHLYSGNSLMVLAFSFFPSHINLIELDSIKQLLRVGGSIGKALRDNFIPFRKEEVENGKAIITEPIQAHFKQSINICSFKVFDIVAQVETKEYVFCTVVEVYSQDFYQQLANEERASCEVYKSKNTLLDHFIRENGVYPIAPK